jgi:hypothetical protein
VLYDQFGVELPQPYKIDGPFLYRITFTDLNHDIKTLRLVMYHPPDAIVPWGNPTVYDITCGTNTCEWEDWWVIVGPSGDWKIAFILHDAMGLHAYQAVYVQVQ